MRMTPPNDTLAETDDAGSRLTARQIACLRLVGQGYETKEIAIELGIAPRRADKDIASAMAKLGVSRRKEAARLLGYAQNQGGNDSPGQPFALPPPPPPRAIGPHDGQPAPANRVREARSSFLFDLGVPVRPTGSDRNDLGLWQRAIWGILLICFVLSAFGMTAVGLGFLSDRRDASTPTR